ncbi:lipoprotein [Streptomyces atrovirens]|uniref:Lipoprotein n=1 Tax=Streptomyces atrovirens TaxID=285556 RepID=A0ABW0DTJ0_9ACTN
MKSTVVRRTALAASAAVLTLLATACGGSSDDDGAAGDAKAGADRSAPADKTDEAAPAGEALTAAELEKVALAQADVKNGEVTTKVPAEDDVAKDQVSADDEACLPLVHAQAAVAQGEPAANVKRSWTGQTETPSEGSGPDGQDMTTIGVDKIMLNLASYEDGGAEKALAELKAAAEKCAGGFTASMGGDELKVAEAATTAAPEGGDEAVAVTLGVDIGKDANGPMKIVVVRKGSTLASFSAVNLSAMMTGADFEVPADVVDAQVAKLG